MESLDREENWTKMDLWKEKIMTKVGVEVMIELLKVEVKIEPLK